MSLRMRIALGTAAIAVGVVGLNLLIGYTSFSRSLNGEIERQLSLWSQVIAGNLAVENGKPVLRGNDWSWLDSGNTVGFRVRKGNWVYLEGGVVPEENDPEWRWVERDLDGGFVLQVSVYVGDYQRALLGQVRAAEVSLPLAVALAVLLGWWFAARVTVPVTELARAADEISQMNFSHAVAVPPGSDEIARLARSFNRMAEAVREALERERSFTRYASHELRTPLATLQAQLETLEAGLTTPQAALPASKRALAKMRAILEGLLTLSREPRVSLEPLPAATLLRQLYESLPPELRSRVRLELPGEEVFVLADEELLRRVVGNLLDNACKHSDGSEVELRLEKKNGEALFTVRDFGPGVSEEELGKLTEPFTRFNQKAPGTGLGLSLSRQAAQALGGRLEFERAKPGLRARLAVPLLEVADA